MNRLNLIGKRFNRLLVISEAKVVKQKTFWNCVCDCGNNVVVWGSAMTTGQTQSCGCLQKERASQAKFKHGVSNSTPEYRTWVNMKTRCYNKRLAEPDYFGRGIKVCDRWLGENGFVNFLSDMGNRPSGLYSIERLDSKGNYEPGNCKWGTEEQQVRNKRNNVWIEHSGLKMILSDWARYFGVDQGNLAMSIKAKGIAKVYQFYLNKHGTLPSKTQYLPPCKSNRRRTFIPFAEYNSVSTPLLPIDELRRISNQLLTALDNT